MTGNNSLDFLNKQLYKAKNKVLSLLGWNNSRFNNGSSAVHNEWLKELREKRSKEFDLSKVEPNSVLPKSILDEFVQIPHAKWIEDNIEWEVQKEFGVCFDLQTERICFPIFDKVGNLIGIKGRATRDKDKEDYKYMPIYSFQKGRELYNLHRALPNIQETNTVILVEAEKSVMKLYGFGHKNVCSQMGSDVTKIQAEIIKRINPDIKVVLAFDKDKSPLDVQQFAKVFDNRENLYGIIDTKNLLENKDSPCDKGKDVWEELYNNHCYKIFS